MKSTLPVLEVLHVLYMMSRSSCSENPPVSLLSSSLVPQPGDSHAKHVDMSKSWCGLIHCIFVWCFDKVTYHHCRQTLRLFLLNPPVTFLHDLIIEHKSNTTLLPFIMGRGQNSEYKYTLNHTWKSMNKMWCEMSWLLLMPTRMQWDLIRGLHIPYFLIVILQWGRKFVFAYLFI